MNFEYAVRSAIFGLVVGDALGVPVEFQSREELEYNPVTGMRADGTHCQPAGTWSDDSPWHCVCWKAWPMASTMMT